MRVPLPASFLSRPIAHRGYHDRAAGCFENSLSAAAAAIAAGYGIEMDLQLSADGVPMVFHDDDLDRLTEQGGPVSARNAADLQGMRLAGGADMIPTLAQVLALVAGRVPLLIEIKAQTLTLSPTDGRLEAATAAVLAGYHGPVALMSFNPDCIAHMARLAPHLPRGLTTDQFDPADWAPVPPETCDRLRSIPDYDATDSSFLSHGASDLASPRVAQIKAAGAAILCWTIRSAQAEAAARKIAANITFEGYAA
ncbi:MAG: phosphodiesterase [Pseudorhodobacter sp.]|nr:phosphodiesterase [Pseudorhodobacter sp.]